MNMKSQIKCDFQLPAETLFLNEISTSTLSKTNNQIFDSNGFLLLKNFIDVENYMDTNIPKERGCITYSSSKEILNHDPIELQVNGSLSRYNYPIYNNLSNEIKLKIEKIIGKKLYKTYYYDRYYFPGQELKVHVDRPSCEISVTVHLGSNFKSPWLFGIKTPVKFSSKDEEIIVHDLGDEVYFDLNVGDAILYKGMQRPHWRNPMPGRKRNFLRKIFKRQEIYYHQIFFHYVLCDGMYSEYAFDI